MEEKEKREVRLVILEKTSNPKTESPLELKRLKEKRRKTMTIIKKNEQNKNETNHKQISQNRPCS